MKLEKHSSTIKAVILGLFLSVGIGGLFAAWEDPTSAPFNDNVPRPVNVGSDSQTKSGSFWAGFLGSDGAGYVDGNFEVGNTITIGGGNPGAGKVLVSQDATGLAAWSEERTLNCSRRERSALSTSVTADCVAGEILTGGGGDCGATASLIRSRPILTTAQWQLSCSRSSDITAYAVCCTF